jgi:hypothetical protein
MYIKKGKVEQIMLYSYNGILQSHKEEKTIAT